MTNPYQNPLTLQDVIRLAKDEIWRFGSCVPTVIVEGGNRKVALELNVPSPTHEEKLRQAFSAGLRLVQSRQVQILEQIFFISEAWMSCPKAGNGIEVPPSQDPDHIEILLIAHRTLSNQRMNGALFEVVRNNTGNLSALKRIKNPLDHMDSPVLDAFMRGFEQGKSTMEV